MKKTSNVIVKTCDIVATLLLLAVIISIICGIRPMIVMSGSMEPEIGTGSLCFVNTKASFEEIEEGDIITYKLLEGKVTHRAVEVKQEGIITKGDANRVVDLGIVTEENFYGKVFAYVPQIGYAFYWIKQNLIASILIVVGLILMPWKTIFGLFKK